jgi:hypothetical protein
MKIRVDFTVEIKHAESLANLRELVPYATTDAEAADFVRMDAAQYVQQYLGDNGVDVEIIRER